MTQPLQPAADRGLSGLGLLMQAAGTAFLGLDVMLGIQLLSAHGEPAMMYVLLALSVLRSLSHRAAGTAILERHSSPQQAIGKYAATATAQTLLTLGYLSTEGFPVDALLAMGLVFLAWPVTAYILTAMAHFSDEVPVAEDRGLEGAGVLMLVFGGAGVLFATAMLYAITRSSMDLALAHLALLALLARGGFHVFAGLRAVLPDGDYDAVLARLLRYSRLGIWVTIGVVAVLALELPLKHASGLVVGAAIMLLAWPLAVGGFARRCGQELGEFAPFSPSPDRGAATLGWLLAGTGSLQLATNFAAWWIGRDEGMAVMGLPLLSAGGSSTWLGMAAGALQLWAALELISVTPRAKLAATVYAFGGGALAVHSAVEQFDVLLRSRMGDSTATLLNILLQLVLPAVALLAVHRKSPSVIPEARVRP
jgi:hypothetical protein